MGMESLGGGVVASGGCSGGGGSALVGPAAAGAAVGSGGATWSRLEPAADTCVGQLAGMGIIEIRRGKAQAAAEALALSAAEALAAASAVSLHSSAEGAYRPQRRHLPGL